jgi:hypothetical protein
MISVLISSAVDHGFEPRSVKPKTMKLIFVASPLKLVFVTSPLKLIFVASPLSMQH